MPLLKCSAQLRSRLVASAGPICAASLLSTILTCASAEVLRPGTELIFGCQGEGCGCTTQTNARA